ncbi:hypothetical protein PMAYCL1PPCAC_14607, partial [Pristionchus mayeri]
RMLALHRFAGVLLLIFVARFGLVAVAADDPDDFGTDRYLCPSGANLIRDGQCRGHCASTKISSLSGLQGAIDYCASANALPVVIKDAEQNSYWAANGANEQKYIPGIVCDESSKKYKWIDGSSIDYKPDSYDISLNGECSSNVWWYFHTGYGWIFNINTSPYDSYPCCISDLYHPKLNDDGCTDFNDDDEDSVCYQISETFENWSDAEKLCSIAGATVASVHNDHENSYLRRLAVSRGFTTGLMLGAAVGISGKSDTFGWIDGSDWDYDNFYPGFPYNAFGDCLVMNTDYVAAQWTNVDCATKLPFVCARKPNSVPETSTTCPGPNIKEGETITTPGYPMDASIPCEFFIIVDVGKKIEMEIILLEANTCCDHLLLYEGTFGGPLIANVTGAFVSKTYTSSTNEMRVSWQPNGGVNVRGLM